MVLYYCGFESFLRFKHPNKPNIHLKPLTDLLLDDQDQVINAFLGWCSLFLQTGNGQVVYLGYSQDNLFKSPAAKKLPVNDLVVCRRAPKYVVTIECGSKETFLLSLDQRLFKWSGLTFLDQEPIEIKVNDSTRKDDGDKNGKETPAVVEEVIRVEQVSVGVEYSAVLTESGEALLIVSSQDGQKDGPKTAEAMKTSSETPKLTSDQKQQQPSFRKLTDKKIISISCGQEHVLMLTDRGRVLSFGRGTRGQLGHGDLLNCLENSQLIDALDGLVVRSIAAGGWHSLALTQDGDVYVWGWNESGQLGYPKETIGMKALPIPLEISDDDRFAAISAGSRHSMALSENGILFGWGWNKWGQLGLDAVQWPIAETPQVIPIDEKVKSITCKFWSSLIETERESSAEPEETEPKSQATGQ